MLLQWVFFIEVWNRDLKYFGLFGVTITLTQIQSGLKFLPSSFSLPPSRPLWLCSSCKHTNTLVPLMYWMVCETQPRSAFEILLLLSKGNSVCGSISATHTKWDPEAGSVKLLASQKHLRVNKSLFLSPGSLQVSLPVRTMPSQTASCIVTLRCFRIFYV